VRVGRSHHRRQSAPAVVRYQHLAVVGLEVEAPRLDPKGRAGVSHQRSASRTGSSTAVGIAQRIQIRHHDLDTAGAQQLQLR